MKHDTVKDTHAIKSFIQQFEITTPYGNHQFSGKVYFKTASVDEESYIDNISITFGYEEQIQFHTNLDSDLYPENFKTIFQDFAFVNNIFLEIKGVHPNPTIGEYTIEVYFDKLYFG